MGAEPPSSGSELDADGGPEADVSPQARRMLAEETRTANGIYGIIVGSAVLVSVHGSTVTQLAVAVLGTLVIYWVAERYAHVMARRIVTPRCAHAGPSCIESSTTGGSWSRPRSCRWACWSAAELSGRRCRPPSWQPCSAPRCCWRQPAGRSAGRRDLSHAARFGSAACAGAFGIGMVLLKTLLH